ncbi:MAG: hypothetical protein Ta2B_08260 [Termitinemataceae bacterium]|nr:MAG: hypothetical protein Ta2B_08260 [Termitinemataceae bacterium]
MTTNLKAYSMYHFRQDTKAHTVYLQQDHRGGDIQNFPAVYTAKPRKAAAAKGDKYIVYRPTVNIHPKHPELDNALSIKKEVDGKQKVAMFTGLHFGTTTPDKAWGDTANDLMKGNDAVLVQFTDNRQVITIYLFKDMKDAVLDLFNKWVNGEICLTVENDIVPLNEGKKTPDWALQCNKKIG